MGKANKVNKADKGKGETDDDEEKVHSGIGKGTEEEEDTVSECIFTKVEWLLSDAAAEADVKLESEWAR